MKEVIKVAIDAAINKLFSVEAEYSIEHPIEVTHGDYATNVALVLANKLGQSPRQVGEHIAQALTDEIEYVDRIEVAGPGFLNFYLAQEFFTTELVRASSNPLVWGRNSSMNNEVVMLEYTSPNLFKPLHIGNLVGNIIGESLTRLLEYNGAVVRRLNYPSDIGLTVAKAVWGLVETNGDPSDISALGEAYRRGNQAYEEDAVAKVSIEEVNQALYAGTDKKLVALRGQGIRTSKDRLNAICATLGTSFDAEIFESEAAPEGVKIVQEQMGRVFEKSEGAVVYKGEKVGLHTRVFLNSKGLPTYEAKDLGNFALKQDMYPDWTQSIIVTGSEQTEYFKVLYAAIREIFPEVDMKHLEHIPTGFLTLTTGKMSSRKGNVLTGESLLAEVEEAAKVRAAETRSENIDVLATEIATAAVKYQILRSAIGSNIVFDKEKALSFEGNSGPYLQYTHARICSVLEKVKDRGIEFSTVQAPKEPYILERLLYRFPEVVKDALEERAPHHVTTYLTELASAFNAFYATEKIADPNDIYAPYKAVVADVVRVTLKNGLWVLGIKAPLRM